jgi:predicted aspartyl protease
MPHFTFPLNADGMIVQAMFGLNGPDTATLVKTQQPVPRPVLVRSLLDSGSDATAIAPRAIQHLGLVPIVPAFSQTAGGMVPVNLYRVSLSISGVSGAAAVVVLPDLLASELTVSLPNIEALIGMNVLRECLLVLDGPGKQFILGS